MQMYAAAEGRPEAGFSLVEVLCAVAIAAAAISVLTAGATQALRSARALDMHLGARIILQSILEDELQASATAPARREGASGPYRWQLDIAPAAGGASRLPPALRMYRLTASVSWAPGGQASASVLKLAP
jgi:prepilin-type N-terminal cleavage/methylation domain-containing protein